MVIHMGEGEKRTYSGSEDFAKSLEPRAKSYNDHETHVVNSLHKASEKKPAAPKPKITDHLKNAFAQPGKVTKVSEKRTVHHHPAPKQKQPPSKHAQHRRKRFEIFAAIYLLIVLASVMLLSAKTEANTFIVLFSFLPTVLTIVIAMVIYEAHRDNKNILWGIPLVLSFAFYWFGTTTTGLFPEEVNVITALNVIFSFVYLIINYFLLQSPIPKGGKGEVKVIEKEVVKEVIPEDLSKFIASIEDKSKALNFVVGRVYNAYHGGTKELRQKINMKQEWYDEFSQIDPENIDFPAVKILISTIEARLHLLEKSEAEVFGLDHKQFKNLVRKEDGSESVLDVLAKNDKDPVKSYVEGALQFCGKVQEFIKKRQSTGVVKNEYVKRDDEKKKPAPRSSWINQNFKE